MASTGGEESDCESEVEKRRKKAKNEEGWVQIVLQNSRVAGGWCDRFCCAEKNWRGRTGKGKKENCLEGVGRCIWVWIAFEREDKCVMP